ncbi:MBL fold metallo-hydrolase [Nitrospira sp. NS4]|uniref:MBL fold metallo-hydrolase n=1 Tax=Nitrospira sp. NS4 TaxID=3414498 RepID=UPI003C2CBE8A
MTTVSEIAPDLFRISTFVPDFNLQFNQFLLRDEEPLLFHTGPRGMFAAVRDAVATVLDPATVKWIAFSHVEADECGSLREWQQLAPNATAVCSLVGKLVSVDDCMAVRPALGMNDGEVLSTGKYRFRFLHTPHVPHCWEAGLLFEETQGTLLCSDLLHQSGDVEPSTQADVLERCRQVLVEYQQGPLANYLPYSTLTEPTLQRLAALQPKTLATMHGSAFVGDGARALRDLAVVLKEVLGPQS